MSSTLVVKTAIHGYHVYKIIWEPHVGDEFIVIQEGGNSHDRYVMAVYRLDEDPGVIVEHLPWEIFKTCHCFTVHSTHLALSSIWFTGLRLVKESVSFLRLGAGESLTASISLEHLAPIIYTCSAKCRKYVEIEVKIRRFLEFPHRI